MAALSSSSITTSPSSPWVERRRVPAGLLEEPPDRGERGLVGLGRDVDREPAVAVLDQPVADRPGEPLGRVERRRRDIYWWLSDRSEPDRGVLEFVEPTVEVHVLPGPEFGDDFEQFGQSRPALLEGDAEVGVLGLDVRADADADAEREPPPTQLAERGREVCDVDRIP
jgi:hypothetical protein